MNHEIPRWQCVVCREKVTVNRKRVCGDCLKAGKTATEQQANEDSGEADADPDIEEWATGTWVDGRFWTFW